MKIVEVGLELGIWNWRVCRMLEVGVRNWGKVYFGENLEEVSCRESYKVVRE